MVVNYMCKSDHFSRVIQYHICPILIGAAAMNFFVFFCLYINIKGIYITDMNDVIKIHMIVFVYLFFKCYKRYGLSKLPNFIIQFSKLKEYLHKCIQVID